MKNNKGFTLIEILAVVIILGILMIIAIPSVSEYISNSRDSSFITSAEKFIDAAIADINAREYLVTNPDYTYYIPTKCLQTDNGDESPYGTWEQSYVVVTYKNTKNYYYFVGRDSSDHGILLTNRELLKTDLIKTGMTSIDTNVGIGGRTKIFIYSDSCDGKRNETTATSNIDELGKK